MFLRACQLVTNGRAVGGTCPGAADRKLDAVSVRVDCRHYSRRTVSAEELVQRCRVNAAEAAPFSCPEHCLFFEERPYRDGGWTSG